MGETPDRPLLSLSEPSAPLLAVPGRSASHRRRGCEWLGRLSPLVGQGGTPGEAVGRGEPGPVPQPRRAVPQSHSEPGQVGPRGGAAGPVPHGFPAAALPH